MKLAKDSNTQEVMTNMVIALINGGEAKTIVNRYHKVWDIVFEYPKEE